jgi:hypothetical protein
MPIEAWFVLSALLSPVGYVMQDVVADAMTVEAVPAVDEHGAAAAAREAPADAHHMQTLGRVAIIGGGVLVSLVNVVMFQGVETLPKAEKVADLRRGLRHGAGHPADVGAGVLLAALLKRRARGGCAPAASPRPRCAPCSAASRPGPGPTGGSSAAAWCSSPCLTVGLAQLEFGQEIIFAARSPSSPS